MRMAKGPTKGAREKAIDYKKVFGTPEGKSVLTDLMDKFYILSPIDHKTEMEAFRAEGKRQAVIWILSQVHCDLVQLDKILRGEI